MSQGEIKLLLIDDDEDCFVQITALLNKVEDTAYHVDWRRSAEEGLEGIQSGEHDACLIDYRLGATDGLNVIEDAVTEGAASPLIILTGQGCRDVDVKAMKLGAADYLEKESLTAALLERTIRYAIDRHEAALQLRQINLELRMKNQELQNFVYTVSHDLKSPVVTLSGFAGHFKRDVEQGRTDRLMMFADRFEAAAQRMRRNVDDLLELSRAGGLDELLVQVDVRLLVGHVLAEMDALHGDRDVNIQIQENLPTVRGDGKRVRRAMKELISNALYHGCGTGATMITIGGDETSRHVRYFVRDDGGGVPETHREKIFELFQQHSHRSGGNGMGLALVRRIAEAHGGSAGLNDGEGATFWIELPKFGPHSATAEAA